MTNNTKETILKRIQDSKTDYIAFCDCGVFPTAEHPQTPVGVWLTIETIDEIEDRVITSYDTCKICQKTIYLMAVCKKGV